MNQPEASDREIAMKVLAAFSEAVCPGYHFFVRLEKQPGLADAATIITTTRANERQKAVEAAQAEKVDAVAGSESDEAYNRAIDDVCRAIINE